MNRIGKCIFFLVASSLFWGCGEEQHTVTPYAFGIPSGYPQPVEPGDNRTTVEGAELGRYLFYDTRLSADNSMSCASCHLQQNAFTDPRRYSIGINGQSGTRNGMALINLTFNPNQRFFWDHRAQTLEEQIFEPIRNPIEMASDWNTVVGKLKNDAFYRGMFREAFGNEQIDSVKISKAIAQFIRTLVSFNSPFDKWARGEGQLSPQELNGLSLIQDQTKGDCFHCHNSADRLFSNYRIMNNGLDPQSAWSNPDFDFGLYLVTGNPADKAKFKVPTLRNIALTAPYMHDGRFNTLEEVMVNHYLTGGQVSETIDPLMEFSPQSLPGNPGLNLTPQDIQDIIAFLNTLTDQEFISNPQFSDPW
jgi:cytochrome c peroxidase